MKSSLRSRTKSAPSVVSSTTLNKGVKSEPGNNLASPGRFLSAKSVYEASRKNQSKPSPKTPKVKQVQKKLQAVKKKTPTRSSKKKNGDAGNISHDISANELLSLELDEASDKSNEENFSASGYDLGKDIEMEPVEIPQESVADEVANPNLLPIYSTLEKFDYIFVSDNKALAFIPFQTCFYFKGRMRVTVLSGVAEIQGYHLEENGKKTYDVYSPRGYSLQCIRSIGKSSKKKPGNFSQWLNTHSVTLEKEMLESKISENILLLLEPLDCSLIDFVSRLFKANVLKKEECAPPHWDLEAQNKLNQLCFRLDSSIIIRGAVFSARYFQQPDVWHEYSQKLQHQIERKEQIRLMVLGGKGVGKSTLLRYLVNRMLKSSRSVLVIDFDPGQPEFFPPGCVSASLVSQPLLGPNFTHFLQPTIFSYFVGDADILTCGPDRYLRSCRQLLGDCRLKLSLSNVPTIINTMGFTNGVGLDVNLDLIRLTQPLQAIQLSSRSARRNFPDLLSHDYVTKQRRGWLAGSQDEHQLPSYPLDVFFSASEFSEKSLEEWGFRPRELRELGLMSYFSRLSTGSDWTLTDATPYRMSWGGLAICICHESIAPAFTMAALNASLVALCEMDSEAASSVPHYEASDEHYPTILQEMPMVPCLGYGLVRGIDTKNGYIYLVTPEPSERLARVNCLVMGGLQLPESMLLDAPLALRQKRLTDAEDEQEILRVPYGTFGPSAVEPACRPYRKYNPMFTLRNKK